MNSMNNNELYHHGILDQKWGIRRYENEDGTLTPAGKKRYNYDIDSAKEKYKIAKKEAKEATKEYKKTSKFSSSFDQKRLNYNNSIKRMELAKNAIADEKIKQKLNEETKKSNHRLKLEEKYLAKGMSDEEAEIAAYKRAKTEKVLAVVGGMTLAAATAYIGYKHYKQNVDQIIKPGTILQNISDNANKGVEDAFYAAYGKTDKMKYAGMYGKTIMDNKNIDKVFKMDIGVGEKGIKIAGDKNALSALKDLMKDKDYADAVKEKIDDMDDQLGFAAIFGKANKNQFDVVNKAAKALDKGEVNKDVYKAINFGLAYHDDNSEKISSGLYKKLKEMGYGGMRDVNDMDLSGYFAKTPMVMFDSDNLTVKKRVELGKEAVGKDFLKSTLLLSGRELAEQAAIGAAEITMFKGAKKIINSKKNDQAVAKYRQEHPDTKLSYNEILENIYKK